MMRDNLILAECKWMSLTPFFPGIAHSQFIRFIVPSGFFVGTATNPCIKAKSQRVKILEDVLGILHDIFYLYSYFFLHYIALDVFY